ncbi:hypothetical protein [Lentisalinibacter orientalis]|uniref:hypothetical protein n=1 Tax=Lentisalinibacter orientalis TaxID=2992241 RepID=UPI003865B6C8
MSEYQLNKVVFELTKRVDREHLLANLDEFLRDYSLTEEERRALLAQQFGELRKLGLLPNLVFRYFRLCGHPVSEFRDRMVRTVVSATGDERS